MDFIDDILTRAQVDPIRDEWNMACLSAGIAAISTHTCAQIMAVLYVHGNNEYMTHHTTFLADVRYIQKRFHLHGAGTPNADSVNLFSNTLMNLRDTKTATRMSGAAAGYIRAT
jgi:hypothetical protein